ncbi:MAG: amino acid ABC transporter permease, partial [Hyphomicrobiales bacterium]
MGGFTLVHLLYLLQATLWTVVLTVLAFGLGSLAGFAVMLARTAQTRWVRAVSMIYVDIIQGTPLLIVLFLIYFGLAVVGIELP